ncbi:MAG: ABC transporter substrate-binding protein [Proteobacteria bacterium]|nr:ABC transporter substrate-binding protein [Pseudomonadota bacterium]
MAEPIHIEFTRFSAFYSPLIATIAGGFLKDEGFMPTHAVSAPGKSAIEGLVAGRVQVAQSAPSQGFGPLEKGEKPPAVHFAQINEMDGFFLAAREPDPAFTWSKLKGRRVILDVGGQPLFMFKYALYKSGLDYTDIVPVNLGSDAMEPAFRRGEADYISMQGPAPQQLEHDKAGYVVASVGKAIGPCAFSSLAARPDWLKTEAASRFMRAYAKARTWVRTAAAAEIAKVEAPFFPGIAPEALAKTIATYQGLGNWTPHLEITRAAWDATNDIFLYNKQITRRHSYEDVIVAPPVS